jgi:hypothetical protein
MCYARPASPLWDEWPRPAQFLAFVYDQSKSLWPTEWVSFSGDYSDVRLSP